MDPRHNAFTRFDVKRFSWLGWILFASGLAVGLACFAVIYANYETINQSLFGEARPPGSHRQLFVMVDAFASVVVGLGCFFAAAGPLWLVGIRVIRPEGHVSTRYTNMLHDD